MEALNKIGDYSVLNDPSLVDFTGRMTVSALGSAYLDCAGKHAQERGFGLLSLNKKNCTWVLSRLVMEMEELPQADVSCSIFTWVEEIQKFFCYRNFELRDSSDVIIGRAQSIWAMIDMQTRKPVDLLSHFGENVSAYVCERECPVSKSSRIRVDLSREPVDIYRARYSDIDINGHMNSIRYIDHILDLFPCETYRNRRISRFEISYLSESHDGDELEFYMDSSEDRIYNIEVCKASSEAVCRARVVFKEKIK